MASPGGCRSPAGMTGGGGYAAAADGGANLEWRAQNKRGVKKIPQKIKSRFAPFCKIRQKQKGYFGHKTY